MLNTFDNLSVTGSVDKITFHDPENGYSVLKVITKDKEPITVTVNLLTIAEGEHIECQGQWVIHPRFGEQFKATQAITTPPKQKNAIEKYLTSGVISGIGEGYAKKLVEVFGNKTLDVLAKSVQSSGDTSEDAIELQRVLAVKGKAWENIKEGISAYLETYHQYEKERIWLTELGLGFASIQKLIKEFGTKTIPIITNNPYILIEKVKGFGFIKSDGIALGIGVKRDSPFRIKAGLIHTIRESNNEGNCYIESSKLIRDAAELLEVEANICLEQLRELVTDDELRCLEIEDTRVVGRRHFDEYEKAIAFKMQHLCSSNKEALLSSNGIQEVITKFEDKTQWVLNDKQREAIATALTKHCLIITGGPGTGKTTITRCISMALANIDNYKLIGCSPTGRAAKRLSESLNVDGDIPQIDCSSIHRLLEARLSSNGKHYFNRNADNKLEVHALIVDEMSMVDVSLFYHVVQALPNHARLIMIGDVDQLPSIGPGKILRDLIESDTIPVVRLTEVQRQAESSKIIANAHRINQGLMPLDRVEGEHADFLFIEEEDPQRIREKLISLACKELYDVFKNKNEKPFNPLLDVQVLSPMKSSVIGVNALNVALQAGLNPDGVQSDNKIKRGDYFFCEGDKVIQLQNNYDKFIMNGDIGFIHHINKKEGLIDVLFHSALDDEDVVPVSYKVHELDQLTLAYATTIHKSQGSEFPIVIMPISTQHYIMLQRNLLYTGITRGKKLVVLIGQRDALKIAIEHNATAKRITNLKNQLNNPQL